MTAAISWIQLRTGWTEKHASITVAFVLFALGVIISGGIVQPFILRELFYFLGMPLLLIFFWFIASGQIDWEQGKAAYFRKLYAEAMDGLPGYKSLVRGLAASYAIFVFLFYFAIALLALAFANG